MIDPLAATPPRTEWIAPGAEPKWSELVTASPVQSPKNLTSGSAVPRIV